MYRALRCNDVEFVKMVAQGINHLMSFAKQKISDLEHHGLFLLALHRHHAHRHRHHRVGDQPCISRIFILAFHKRFAIGRCDQPDLVERVDLAAPIMRFRISCSKKFVTLFQNERTRHPTIVWAINQGIVGRYV